MVPVQAVVYNWVKQTATLKQDPSAAMVGKTQHAYATLNNKAMELRKVLYPAAPAALNGAHTYVCQKQSRGSLKLNRAVGKPSPAHATRQQAARRSTSIS